MKRLLIWIVAMVLTVAGGVIGIGFVQDHAFNDEHTPPGRLLRAGEYTIHAIDSPGPSRPVIFIHGNPGTAEDFAEIQRLLSPKVHTIALDRPGYGWSQRPRDDMAPRAQARILHDALKELAITDPVLVGFSFGGPVITEWALEYPDEVAGLIYLCAVADPVEGHPLKGAQANLVTPVLGRAIAYGAGPIVAPDAVEAGYAEAFSPRPVDKDTVARGKVQFARPTTLLASAWDWKMLETELPKIAGRYKDLDLPVVALSANQDKIVGPSHVKYLADHVRGIRVTHLDNAGHQVMSTHSNEVVLAVLQMLDKLK